MPLSDPPASEIMRRDVLSVRDEDTVWSVAQVFAEKRISGAPVVNAAGELVGVISQTDIVRHLEEIAASFRSGFYAEAEADREAASPALKASDLMHRDVIDAPPTAKASELSRLMLERRIHRVIITEGRKLLGIVTTMDVLRVL